MGGGVGGGVCFAGLITGFTSEDKDTGREE